MSKWLVGIPVVLFILMMVIGHGYEQTPEGKAHQHKRDLAELCETDKEKALVTDTRYQVNCDAFADLVIAHEGRTPVGAETQSLESAPAPVAPSHYAMIVKDDPYFNVSMTTEAEWMKKCKSYAKSDKRMTKQQQHELPSCEQEWKDVVANKQ
jgi:hypothetical protein